MSAPALTATADTPIADWVEDNWPALAGFLWGGGLAAVLADSGAKLAKITAMVEGAQTRLVAVVQHGSTKTRIALSLSDGKAAFWRGGTLSTLAARRGSSPPAADAFLAALRYEAADAAKMARIKQ